MCAADPGAYIYSNCYQHCHTNGDLYNYTNCYKDGASDCYCNTNGDGYRNAIIYPMPSRHDYY